MHHYAASGLDQAEVHQILEPIALGVETPKIDKALQWVVYLHVQPKKETYLGDRNNTILSETIHNYFLFSLDNKLNYRIRKTWTT